MIKHTNSAVIVGSLFLVALILNLIATEIFNPILNATDYLNKVYPGKNLIVLGNLLNTVCAIAMIFIPISLFTVVPKPKKYLAVIYIVFRAIEGILFLFLAIKSLTFITLSGIKTSQGALDASFLKAVGDSIHAEIHWATVIYILIFTLGGFVFYSLLFTTKLLPRFISVWGLAAIALLFIGVVMGMFNLGIFSSTPLLKGMAYFAPPIALNELFLGFWLIIKGYSPPTQDNI